MVMSPEICGCTVLRYGTVKYELGAYTLCSGLLRKNLPIDAFRTLPGEPDRVPGLER